MPKLKTIADWTKFLTGRLIIILPGHEWEGEKTTFIEMVWADGTIPNPTDKPGEKLRVKVKTRFGTELILKGSECFFVEKVIPQRPAHN